LGVSKVVKICALNLMNLVDSNVFIYALLCMLDSHSINFFHVTGIGF
jgi:hypothetical protein